MGRTTRIDLTEYDDEIPDVGHRVRVNHNNCPAGLDTKKRLEIKHKEDGDVIAYCHHCSGWGLKRNGMVRSIHKRPASSGTLPVTSSYTLPSDGVFDPLLWPKDARRWPKMYGITDQELKDNSICYSPGLKRVVIPCYTVSGELTGYQTRKVHDEDTKPKYLTRAKKGGKFFRPAKATGVLPYIVLVEDALSAIKLARLVKYPVAVLGSDLPTLELCDILDVCKEATHILIAFDNDNKHVKENQHRLLLRAQLLSSTTDNKIIYLSKDPKEYSIEELRKELNDFGTPLT